jgi:IS4 transposase
MLTNIAPSYSTKSSLCNCWIDANTKFKGRENSDGLSSETDQSLLPGIDKILIFLTNQLEFGATTISAIYKDRWQMEIFFKARKQNLKIRTFVGTSANAVKIPISTALIGMLILRFLQLRSQFHWSLSNLVALLRMNLFTHRDLWAWLNKPFDVLPIPYEFEQLKLQFA